MSNRVIRLVNQSLKRIGSVFLDEIKRVGSFRQRKNAKVYVLSNKQVQDLIRPPLTSFVAVQNQRDAIGESFHDSDMAFVDRRPLTGNHVPKSRLISRNHIGVAFHDG